ncbi:MAG: PQQ-binding-like beta-propeller repeat protein [Chloroflexi bacterium]|nr:PQQ-binding-like beta-propeller repeat protein [Chloroflexota bacterium]
MARPRGWASGVVHEGVLYKGTTDGRLVAINSTNGKPIARFELDGGESKDKNDKRAVYGNPVFYDGAIYVSGYDGYLYSLAQVTSTNSSTVLSKNWGKPVGETSELVGGPAVADGIVVVGSSDGNVYAFDVETQEELWQYETGNKIWATPTVQDDVVYIGSLDKYLYALKLTGSDEEVGERLLWRFKTEGAISAKPVVVNNHVYFGSFDSNFYAVDIATGNQVWRFEGAGNWYWAEAVVSGDAIYVPSMDSKLYALDVNTGAEKWMLETEGAITGKAALVSGRIVVGSDDQNLYIANPLDGGDVEICRIRERLRSDLVTEGDMVYISTWDHAVVAVEINQRGDPKSLWRHITNKGDDWIEKWEDEKGQNLC